MSARGETSPLWIATSFQWTLDRDLRSAHGLGRGQVVGMRAVAEVQAKHIGPGIKQGADGGIVAGSRAKGCHDLHVTKASHAQFLFDAHRCAVVFATYGPIGAKGQLAVSALITEPE